jgi:16S rRNA (guanine966-N2)-methyltransferase
MSKTQAGQLRIVAGIWRSRLLQIADVDGLRPTSSRIRETLFNWLGPNIHGARCLDLCAGTGALGIEALSRGAAAVLFVENSRSAAATLRQNLSSLDASGAEIVIAEAQDVLATSPPRELCRLLSERAWLAASAQIYIELDKQKPVPRMPDNWRIDKDKTAGNVRYMLTTNET